MKLSDNIVHQISSITSRMQKLNPLVVVKCLTYNHKDYIKDTMDGFIKQRTQFPFVVIIHDDASTDGTVEIIKEYQKKYPNLFMPIFEEVNQYSIKPALVREVLEQICQLSGVKYVALCEGDDYWTNPFKLQKQVSLLEENQDISMCFHNVRYFDQHNGKSIKRSSNSNKDKVYSICDLIEGGGGFCPTCSIVYRNDIMKSVPDFIKMHIVGDYPLQLMCGLKGDVYYMNEYYGVYRINSYNSWTSQNEKSKSKVKRRLLLDKSNSFLDEFNAYTSYKFEKSIYLRKRMNIYEYYMDRKRFFNAIRWIPRNFKSYMIFILKITSLYNLIKRLR